MTDFVKLQRDEYDLHPPPYLFARSLAPLPLQNDSACGLEPPPTPSIIPIKKPLHLKRSRVIPCSFWLLNGLLLKINMNN